MRISKILRASFVGSLLFSPVMADDVEQVHEEALRVLHQMTSRDGAAPAPAAPTGKALSGDLEIDRARAEREARIKAEVKERMAERERLQAERRQQFEQYVRDRERMRKGQREYDENAARITGQIKGADYNEVHAKALAALHQAQAQQPVAAPVIQTAALTSAPPEAAPIVPVAASASVAPAAAAPGALPAAVPAPARVAEAPPAPRLMAAASNIDLPPDNTDVHAKALEVLHQQPQTQAPPAPAKARSGAEKAPSASGAPTTTTTSPATANPAPGPSPELQQRLKQMQLELEQEQAQKKPASPSATDSSSAARTPALDAKTREMLRRQDQEIAKQGGATNKPAQSSVSVSRSKVTAAKEEAKPVEKVKQPEKPAPKVTVVPKPEPKVEASPSPAPALQSSTIARGVQSDAANLQYSKDLEERARQMLIERAQAQSNPTFQPVVAPTPVAAPAPAVPVVSAPVAAAAAPAPAATLVQPVKVEPARSPAAAAAASATARANVSAAVPAANADVHAKALETLNQAPSAAESTGPKTKMQRLKELTDLYRADKIGPAEYHQKRAQILAEPQ